jgi:DNA-binding response OmpR family regulator
VSTACFDPACGQLAFKPGDAWINRSVQRVAVLRWSEIQNFIPRHQAVGMRKECPEQYDLADAQPLDRAVVVHHKRGPEIDRACLEPDSFGRLAGFAGDQSLNARKEFTRFHRLLNDVIRAKLQTQNPVQELRRTAHHDDRHFARCPDPHKKIASVFTRHGQIKHNDIRRMPGSNAIIGIGSLRDDSMQPAVVQVFRKGRDEVDLVVNQNDTSAPAHLDHPPEWLQDGKGDHSSEWVSRGRHERADMSGEDKRIAVVDDEDDLRDAVVEYLGMSGYVAEGYARAAAFREAQERDPVDLAILDIAMPGEDGLSLARWIRKRGKTGIIFATAAGTSIDRIIGLELGADDYIVKPYELREMLARVRSVLRRLPPEQGQPVAGEPAVSPSIATSSSKRIRFGGMVLDLEARVLSSVDGAPIDLTAMELDLLAALATRQGRPLSRAQIIEYAGGVDGGDAERAIDIRVTRLRRKIEPNPDTPRYVKTVRGTGYVFLGD